MGVQSFVSRPCGPDFTPSPNATNGVFSATRREVWVTGFDCGAGVLLYRRALAGAVASAQSAGMPRFSPSSLRAVSTEGSEGVKMMRTDDDRVARRRDERARDRGGLSVTDVQRRLTARPAHGARTESDVVAPTDPRCAYLARTTTGKARIDRLAMKWDRPCRRLRVANDRPFQPSD